MKRYRVKFNKCKFCIVADMLSENWCNLDCEIKDKAIELNNENKLTNQQKKISAQNCNDIKNLLETK